ncbi:MAG: ATP-binding cassette domain-containing protein, partial [Oscillospiraceae bacterium]|nr:ATP-binding cassette domain-containing protein [Oscillospiraceae bacterium]
DKKKAKNFSLGMRQRLGIAIALAGNPDFLVLDEPVNGLDPQGIIETRELILKLNRERGITVLISSHILDELSRLATHYGFIDGGRIVKEISAEQLERECRKCMRVTVTDMKILSVLLTERGVEFAVVDDKTADIFGEISITELAVSLGEKGCELLTANERDESLETYFMNLVGVQNNE